MWMTVLKTVKLTSGIQRQSRGRLAYVSKYVTKAITVPDNDKINSRQYRKSGKEKAYNTCIAPHAAYRSCSGAVHVTDSGRTAYS